VAVSLVERQAGEIVLFAEVAMRRLGLLGTPVEVVLGGGVATARDPLLTRLVEDGLARRAPQAKPVITDAPPIVGAALLGLDLLDAPEDAKITLRDGLGRG
jgi:hypothetical protein